MSDMVRPTAHEETRAVGGSALLALVGASLPMNLDPAIHNIAVVAAGNTLHMTGADRSLAASIGTLCAAASTGSRPSTASAARQRMLSRAGS